MENCQLGESWKSRDDTQPSHPALEWGPCWFTPPWMGVRAPTASLSTLPEDGGTGTLEHHQEQSLWNESGWEWESQPWAHPPTAVPSMAKDTVGIGFYFAQGIPSPSHTLRPNTSVKELKRPRKGCKGWGCHLALGRRRKKMMKALLGSAPGHLGSCELWHPLARTGSQ